MIKLAISFCCALLLLSSCGEETARVTKRKKKVDKQHTFFNLQRIFSPLEKEISFPIWFDASMIVENKVEQITRRIYPLNETDSTAVYPKEEWIYSFDKKGNVKKVQIAHFYENTKTDEVNISYAKSFDEYGFSEAKMKEKNGRIVNTLQQHSKEEYGDRYLIYENKSSGDYLFYVLDPNLSGVVSIDQMLSPTVQDVIGIGSPLKISERFILKNKVEQNDKIVFSYDTKHLEKIEFDQRPFTTSRYIHYDDEGHCSGFTDSTYTGQKYLSCVSTNFQEKMGVLPLRVIHSSQSADQESNNLRLEVFDYQIKEK